MPVGRLIAIGAGGVFGATVRWALLEIGSDNSFPWPTFVANVVGSALLAWVSARPMPPTAVAALGTGFCGGLTTFSTFSLEIVELVDEGRGAGAIGYAASSVVVAVVVFALVRRLAGGTR